MTINRFAFTEQLEAFIQQPTIQVFFRIRQHLKSQMSELDIEAWALKVEGARILYCELSKDILQEHVPLLLLLSIAKESGIGIEKSISDSANILDKIISLVANKQETKMENLTPSSSVLEQKEDTQYKHIKNLLGLFYYLRGRCLVKNDIPNLQYNIKQMKLAQLNGFKPPYDILGMLYYRFDLNKSLAYFQLAVEEENNYTALVRIGHIYIKHNRQVSEFNKLSWKTCVQLGIKKFRDAMQKGINVDNELLNLSKLFPKSIELLYQAALLALDKDAISKLKTYIHTKKENAAEVFEIILRNNDNLTEVIKILLLDDKTKKLFNSWIPKQAVAYKSASSAAVLEEFQREFTARKQIAIKDLIERGGEQAECFAPFLSEYKSGNPKLLFSYNALPPNFPDSSLESGNPTELKKAEAKLQELEKAKQQFIQGSKQPTQETADAKFQGRIEKEQKIITTNEKLIRQQQLDHLLLFIDDYSKDMLDFALGKNIPPLFIEKIEDLTALFYYYQAKYHDAQQHEYFAPREKFYQKYNDNQTLFTAVGELRIKHADLKDVSATIKNTKV